MAGVCRITVEIPKKSYDIIRKRAASSDHKTSRVLSRYLYTFFTILEDGEDALYRAFTPAEARRIATVLDIAHRADEVPWDEFCTFTGPRLGALIGLYAPNETIIISKVSGLGALEILALMEYAQMIDSPDRFEQQTAKFCA